MNQGYQRGSEPFVLQHRIRQGFRLLCHCWRYEEDKSKWLLLVLIYTIKKQNKINVKFDV